jgi:hypothetical protein
MYTKDKNTRITLRLNEQQFDFVKWQSNALGVSPSEFLRMVVNLAMTANDNVTDSDIEELINKGVGRRENENADSNNIV